MSIKLKRLALILMILGLWVSPQFIPRVSYAQVPTDDQTTNDDDDFNDEPEPADNAEKKIIDKKVKKVHLKTEQFDEPSDIADGGTEVQLPDRLIPEPIIEKQKSALLPEKKKAQLLLVPTTANPPPALKSPKKKPAAVKKMASSQKQTPEEIIQTELRIIYGIIIFLAAAFILLLLNFLLPFKALRFLSILANLFVILSLFGFLAELFYQRFIGGHWPGDSLYSGILWFAFIALWVHTWLRRRFRYIYLSLLPLLLLFVLPALLWAITLDIPLNGAVSLTHSSPWFILGNIAMMTALGFMAAGLSWQFSSCFLRMLAKRGRGIGYGLEHPEDWNYYQHFPTFFAMLAFPTLTLAWIFHAIWSFLYYPMPWGGWIYEQNLWVIPFSWLLLGAYFFSLRLPTKPPSEFIAKEFVVKLDAPRKLSLFLFFLATVGGVCLFVGAGYLHQLFS